MNSHDMQHDTAAVQQIIKALALPALSRAPEPPRPMPLSHLPRLPRETSMLRPLQHVSPGIRAQVRPEAWTGRGCRELPSSQFRGHLSRYRARNIPNSPVD